MFTRLAALERSGVGWNRLLLAGGAVRAEARSRRAHPQFQFPFSFAPLMFSVHYVPFSFALAGRHIVVGLDHKITRCRCYAH